MSEEQKAKSKTAEREEEILKFWKEHKIFEKSLEKEAPKGEFVFYDGPATANAKPVLHTMEPFAYKDILPRYKTMRGFHVARQVGWDTHGLPVELQIEKKLGFTSKKEIEQFGIEKFNKLCRESVWEFIQLWKDYTNRMGYWADQDHPYITYENEYMASVWNVVKKVEEKGLLYKDYKVVPWCPRCGTALSSHELAQGYEDVKDLSVTAKFKLKAFPNAYFLAWTTTPWTLPGNVALAVGKDTEYVEAKVGEEIFVLAKERLSVLNSDYEILATHKGSEMVGMEYEPLYNFIPNDTKGFENAYKVYAADFVNTEDGTGIVHTAVMYGQDDFELGTEVALPKFHIVKDDGHYLDGMDFLSGRFVKDEETAVEIIKDLAHRGLLFKKEKYEHSYPHCWRCKTPLIYYARDSWYIGMSKLRDELVKENEKIHWEPSHIKEGRFGEWLKEVKDWAISRERYWGTPLPVWQNEKGERIVIGSIDELKKHTKKNGNRYFLMRHGESENNAANIVSHDPNLHRLTEKGKAEVLEAARFLKGKKIDIIYMSPFLRAKETAEIIADELGLSKDQIIVDNRIREFNFGDFHLKSFSDFIAYRDSQMTRLEDKIPNGESYFDSKKRVGEFLYDIDRKHAGRNILVVGHGVILEVFPALAEGADSKRSKHFVGEVRAKNAEIHEYDFVPLPHNENYELDLHRPYIDDAELVDEEGNKLTRVKEVMDVWFDSGSMPFASGVSGYPAHYIAEAVDQTRGWFYVLHAIGVLMGKGAAYKNVISLGHILDKDGQKMSKSKGNVVDPWIVMDKFGVDALRLWMYSVNGPGDSKNFDERTVQELVQKVFNPLENILSFYDMYSGNTRSMKYEVGSKEGNILDQWILSRLNQLIREGEKNLDSYKIFEASRLIRDFVNDFSTWYIRRSRERFKSDDVQDKMAALHTTKFVLLELAKYMAPFTPFFAEYVYRTLKLDTDPESVHLCKWPKIEKVDEEILKKMAEVRRLVSLGLEKRNAANIKVRQPLSEMRIKNNEYGIEEEYLELIKEEVNVKSVREDTHIAAEVELDTAITPELKREGDIRELIRTIQDLRKEKGLTPDQKITLQVETGEEGQKFLEKNKAEISKTTNISEFEFGNTDEIKIKIGNFDFGISIILYS